VVHCLPSRGPASSWGPAYIPTNQPDFFPLLLLIFLGCQALTQRSHRPRLSLLCGSAPTTGWVTGEVIADGYERPVDPRAGSGQYVLEVGMYLGETRERLSVYNVEGELLGDRILLPFSIEVR
jgi:hypothetical protein